MTRAGVIRVAVLAAVVAAMTVVVRALRGEPTGAFDVPSVSPGVLRPAAGPAAAAIETSTPAGGRAAEALDEPTTARLPEPEPDPEPEGGAEEEPEAVAEQLPAAAPNPPGQRWVFPEDGRCPESHPIKAKLRSGLYHLPGMAAYERTKPDRCYATTVDAEADGLVRAKR